MTISRSDGQLYLDINGSSLSTAVHVHELG